MEQVLWFEAAMKGVIGIALVAAPMTVLRLFGLHRDNRRFWPRLVGFLLLGIAAGVLFGLLFPSAKGAIGPTGLIADAAPAWPCGPQPGARSGACPSPPRGS